MRKIVQKISWIAPLPPKKKIEATTNDNFIFNRDDETDKIRKKSLRFFLMHEYVTKLLFDRFYYLAIASFQQWNTRHAVIW